MTELLEYLRESAKIDGDRCWRWDDTHPIHRVGREEADALISELEANGQDNVKIVPVQGWYLGGSSKPIPPAHRAPVFAKALAERHKKKLMEDVYKLTYTGNTNEQGEMYELRTPSVFISPIPGGPADAQVIHPGDKMIVVDDFIGQGATVRDLIRHIENRHAKVVGVIESDTPKTVEKIFDDKSGRETSKRILFKKCEAIEGKNQIPWYKLDEDLQPQQVAHYEEIANRRLAPLGLHLDQLHDQEFARLSMACDEVSRSKECSVEGIWDRALHNLSYPKIEIVERPEQLAEKLGASYTPSRETPGPEIRGRSGSSAWSRG